MKLSTIILSSIIALVPLNALAQNDWSRFPQWVKQRSNPHQFVQIGNEPAFYLLADKKLIPLGGNKYGFIFRKQIKRRTPNPGPEYTEIYGVLDCGTGDYDVIGKVRGDNRGNTSYFHQCKGSDCLSPYAREPEPQYVAIIQKNFCPRY
jgi:hypothetical protein